MLRVFSHFLPLLAHISSKPTSASEPTSALHAIPRTPRTGVRLVCHNDRICASGFSYSGLFLRELYVVIPSGNYITKALVVGSVAKEDNVFLKENILLYKE